MNEAQLVVPAKKRKPNPDNRINRLSLFGGVSVLWLGSAIIIVNSINDPAERGQIGDMFGAVNSLFSGLAFAGIIYTIILQRIELKAQRQELALTRKEIKGQKKEFKIQNSTLKRQRFEGVFFQMLSLHFKILESIKVDEYTGVTAIAELTNRYTKVIFDFNNRVQSNVSTIDRLTIKYHDEMNITQIAIDAHLSSYIQSLIQLHKTIVQSKFKLSTTNERYFSVLRTYLSLNEFLFLHYYISSKVNNEILEFEKDLNILNDPRMSEFHLAKFPEFQN